LRQKELSPSGLRLATENLAKNARLFHGAPETGMATLDIDQNRIAE
jgi:hypothetical protein